MARFKGSLGRTFIIRRPMDDVVATMTDPVVFHRFISGVEEFEPLQDGQYRFRLTEKREKGVRFQGRYIVRYELDGPQAMRWYSVGDSTSDSNMSIEGLVRFAAEGDVTGVTYEETIVCDMEVNRLLGRIIQPVVRREISQGVSKYLDRVRAHLEA